MFKWNYIFNTDANIHDGMAKPKKTQQNKSTTKYWGSMVERLVQKLDSTLIPQDCVCLWFVVGVGFLCWFLVQLLFVLFCCFVRFLLYAVYMCCVLLTCFYLDIVCFGSFYLFLHHNSPRLFFFLLCSYLWYITLWIWATALNINWLIN